MAVPSNILQQVQTYQKAELAFLLNSFFGIRMSNKRFRNFNELTANLGDTVNFDLAPRYVSANGLVVTQQPSVQRLQSLVCSQALNVTSAFTDQQFIFNVQDYMDRFGQAAVLEIGNQIESDILRNFISGVRVNDPQNSNFGQLQTQSGPFRFYGNGIDPINSFTQLAQAVANFRDFGSAKDKLMGVFPEVAEPAIVGTGLQQFALTRNNDTAMSWMVGNFAGCEWSTSNLLPIQHAGFVGNATPGNNVMTVVSTNDPTGQNITQITATEPTSSTAPNAVNAGDLMQFNDGVGSFPNLRFLQFIGHQPSAQPVQFRCTQTAGSSSGTVVINLQTATGIGLVSAPTQNQNLNNVIQPGMQFTVMPSHRAGAIMSGNQFYLAMPQLPDQMPYPTVITQDAVSGATIRHYWGTQFGQNLRDYVRDAIWGSTLVAENSMRLLFPL